MPSGDQRTLRGTGASPPSEKVSWIGAPLTSCRHRCETARPSFQSTLEWVIGAAIILGTLVVGIMAWNNGLVTKIGQMVQRLTQTS